MFYAQQNTTYRITLTWAGDPSCQAWGGCGYVQEYLYDSAMNIVDKAGVSDPGNNQINPVTMNGAPGQPLNAGVYFIELSGSLGLDASGQNWADVGYRLDVNATPDVVWPPGPAPVTSTPAPVPTPTPPTMPQTVTLPSESAAGCAADIA